MPLQSIAAGLESEINNQIVNSGFAGVKFSQFPSSSGSKYDVQAKADSRSAKKASKSLNISG